MCRWLVVVAFGLFGFSSHAVAQIFDTPTLRGSSPFTPAAPKYRSWEGAFVGGQMGYAGNSANLSGGVEDLVANILRNTLVQNEFQASQWANLPKQGVSRPSFGGFMGYNVQYEDAVVGVEVNYKRTNVRMASGDTVARVVNTSNGYANSVVLSGTGSVHLTDYATLRFRGGWADNTLMPYGFVGLAVGRANLSRSASIAIVGVDANPGCVGPPNICLPPYTFSQSQSDARSGAIGYGWTAGAGIDWMLYSSIFLRGEFEYVSFPNYRRTAVAITAAHLAAGIRF
jgi:outer membrane immunogenic protein